MMRGMPSQSPEAACNRGFTHRTTFSENGLSRSPDMNTTRRWTIYTSKATSRKSRLYSLRASQEEEVQVQGGVHSSGTWCDRNHDSEDGRFKAASIPASVLEIATPDARYWVSSGACDAPASYTATVCEIQCVRRSRASACIGTRKECCTVSKHDLEAETSDHAT